MDIKQLTYICTVAEYKSITKAAKHLYISQPSLSHYISKLEEELGVRLFDRTTNPISLTYAGEKYVEAAYDMLNTQSSMLKELSDISQSKKGRIKIGMPRERATYMMPLMMSEFKKVFPNTEIQMIEGNTSLLMNYLEKGRVDYVIAPKTYLKGDFDFEHIYSDPLLLIISHELADKYKIPTGEVDISLLKGMPYISRESGQSIRETVRNLLGKRNIEMDVVIETASNMTAYRLATAGLGAAIVPEMTLKIIKSVNEAEHRRISDPSACLEIVAMWRKDAYMSLTERKLLDIAKRLFA